MLSALLALALPALAQVPVPPAGVATSSAPAASGSARELVPELQQLIGECLPLFGQLNALQERYQIPGAIRRLGPERDRLRGELRGRVNRFTQLYGQYDERRQMDQAAQIQGALASFMGGVIPKNPLIVYSTLKQDVDFAHFLHGWLTEAEGKLVAEEVAFKAAERVARRNMVLAAAAGVLFVLLIAALLWVRRTTRAKNQLETDITRLAAASGSVYQGVGTAPPGAVTGTATVLGGNYVIDRELGRGGMGIVYEATDLSLRRKVAVKKLREELHERATELETLLAEARMVASLRHPNIVEIHSIFKEAGRIFLVFEYVSGRPLSAVLEERACLTLREAKAVLRQIAAALDYAHSQRIIHKDLKPANIMITAEGVVKVMDFGIAHRSRATVAKQTRSEAWGTPPYMAPEQEMGTVSRESDVYALGACFYEMLTGNMPFNGPNFLAQKNAMHYAKATRLKPDLPAGVDAVVEKALAPDPTFRYHTAGEFAAAVEALPD